MALMSRGGAGGTLVGAPPRGYDPAYGGIPQIPSPIASAGKAIGGNIGNLGGLYQLGQGYNTFQTGQAHGQIAQGLPGYDAMLQQSSANIVNNLKGQVSPDVVRQIIQTAAERGIITGTTGSQSSNSAMLQALGLTSLGLQQTGENQVTGAIARTPHPALFDPATMFVHPEQQQEAATAANTFAAAPVPSAAAGVGLGAAQSGLRAGMGSISAPARNPFAPANPSFNPFAPASQQGGYYDPSPIVGGALYPQEAPNPNQAYTNWQQWNSGLPRNTGQQYFQEDFTNEFPDVPAGEVV